MRIYPVQDGLADTVDAAVGFDQHPRPGCCFSQLPETFPDPDLVFETFLLKTVFMAAACISPLQRDCRVEIKDKRQVGTEIADYFCMNAFDSFQAKAAGDTLEGSS